MMVFGLLVAPSRSWHGQLPTLSPQWSSVGARNDPTLSRVGVLLTNGASTSAGIDMKPRRLITSRNGPEENRIAVFVDQSPSPVCRPALWKVLRWPSGSCSNRSGQARRAPTTSPRSRRAAGFCPNGVRASRRAIEGLWRRPTEPMFSSISISRLTWLLQTRRLVWP